MKSRARLGASTAAILVLSFGASCSSGDDGGGESAAATTSAAGPATTAPDDGTATTSTVATGSTTSEGTTTTVAPTTTVSGPVGPPYLDADLPPVVLTTALSGGGDRPVLSWEAVDGAARYDVLLLEGDGDPYWGWSGTATEVLVGEIDLAPETPGPRVTGSSSWAVIAVDDESLPVAVSEVRPVAP